MLIILSKDEDVDYKPLKEGEEHKNKNKME